MGSVGLGNNALLGAFQSSTFATGLDLGRCQIREALGVFVADPAATFSQGQLVMKNSSGLVVQCDGTDVLGVAKWNKSTGLLGVKVDEAIVLNGTDPSNLSRANVSNVKVSATAGGAAITASGNYTLNTTNGTVARIALGVIGDGDTVYVSYTFAITSQEVTQQHGTNFWNNLDEVSQADNRVTVITDAELLFTTHYDTSRQYALTGASSNLYAGTGGLFTNDNASGKFMGRVMQLPTASDPFLGLRLVKSPLAD